METAVYSILKKVKVGENTIDQRHLTKWTLDVIATAHRASYGAMTNILHDNFSLLKQRDRWVPRLLRNDQKNEQVRISRDFNPALARCPEDLLASIVTLDETMVSYQTHAHPMPTGQNRCALLSSISRGWSTRSLRPGVSLSMPTTPW
jgi:hypothetical protein